MADYYVNNHPQENGDHEVHRQGCMWMPNSKTYLGNFATCREAVTAARRHYWQSNGCYYCSHECHTG